MKTAKYNFTNEWESFNGCDFIFVAKGINLDSPFYRYMSVFSLRKLLSGEFIAKCPSEWEDPYERFFVDTNEYAKIGFTKPSTYCMCFTKNSSNEAAWKVYPLYQNKLQDAARVEYKMKDLLTALSTKKFKEKVRFYLGPVIYDLKGPSILSIGKKRSVYYHQAFDSFNTDKYADLLLLKRRDFKYEEEYRLIITIDGPQNNVELNIALGNPTVFFPSIQISPLCKDNVFKKYKKEFSKIIGKDSVTQSKLYKSVSPLKIETSTKVTPKKLSDLLVE